MTQPATPSLALLLELNSAFIAMERVLNALPPSRPRDIARQNLRATELWARAAATGQAYPEKKA